MKKQMHSGEQKFLIYKKHSWFIVIFTLINHFKLTEINRQYLK